MPDPHAPAPAADPTERFADRLLRAVGAVGSPACVGLDPVAERLPSALAPAGSAGAAAWASAVESFCMGVLDAVAGVAAVVKPQSACFEAFGAAGVAALERVCAAAADRGMVVILDVKRGDIGVTAERYADAAFGVMRAHAATLSGYMGPDTIEPWLAPAWRGRGVFVLVRTSNPGSDALQRLAFADGDTLADRVADMVRTLGDAHVGASGFSDVGAVVAATKPDDAARLRERMPRQIFLVPGYGAQGGTAQTVRELFRPGPAGGPRTGAVVNASRSVIFPFEPGDPAWRGRIADAGRRFADEMRGVAGS